MRYRRANVNGGTYFFSVNLAERNRALLVVHVEIFRAVLQGIKERHPFRTEALVILPDLLHAIWTLPKDDRDFPTRWMLIKAGFPRHIAAGERWSDSPA